MSEDTIATTALVLLIAHPWMALGVSMGALIMIGIIVLWIFRAVWRRIAGRSLQAIA